jgi:hypothetical protein
MKPVTSRVKTSRWITGGPGVSTLGSQKWLPLVRRKAAVIATNTPAAPVAKATTTEIPIVFVSTGDPVMVGLVASFNRPGGNVTGVGLLGLELESKRLGLLHQLVPGTTPITVLVNPDNPAADLQLRELQQTAGVIKRQIDIVRAKTTLDIEAAFAITAKQGASALLVVVGSGADARHGRWGELRCRPRLRSTEPDPRSLATLARSRAPVQPVADRGSGAAVSCGRSAVDVEQLLNRSFDLFVSTLAGVLEHDLSTLVDNILRGPILVSIGIPGGVFVILRDRVADAVAFEGGLHVARRSLERKLRRMDADDDEALVLIGVVKSRKVRESVDAVIAAIRPKIDQDDLATQVSDGERD